MLMNQEEENNSQPATSPHMLTNIETISIYDQAVQNLSALMYKSIRLQKVNYCSNICQILTPLLCIAFTLAVQAITGQLVTSKISSFNYPFPLDLPILYQILPNISISCDQYYLYQIQQISDTINAEIMLNHILKFYCNQSNQMSPYFKKVDNVNHIEMNILEQADKQQFERGNDLKTRIPDGIIKFHSLNTVKLNITIGINDYRLAQYHRNNGITKILITSKSAVIASYLRVTQGLMSLLQKIARSFLQFNHPKQIIMGSIMYMPFDGQDTVFMNKIVNVIGTGLYPLGLSLLLPLFLYTIVVQKQQKLIQIMRMNGLNVKYYWINIFIFNFIISFLTSSLFYCIGKYIFQLTFFTQTKWSIIWIVLIGWNISQISLTNFIQIFINNAKSASIIGYLLSIFSTLIGQTICTLIYPFPKPMPIYLIIYPPFALCRSIYLLGFACTNNCYNSLLNIDLQLLICIIIMYSWFWIFIISIWLNQMVQQDYGVTKQPDFIKYCINRCCSSKNKQIEFQDQTQGDIQMNSSINYHEDKSIEQIYYQTIKCQINSKPMIIKQLTKKYQEINGDKDDEIALKPLTLFLEEKEIFGLLGPNGAGKTTLISVLTGMYPQTAGNAWIKGMQVGYSQTNRCIGVCPQFDLLWPELTVYHHLKFYAKLKLGNKQQLQTIIEESISNVDLIQFKDIMSKQLSGGMQRRLSLAIALIGSPAVVFLDQPSSGLDPLHRHQMWSILSKCKAKTSILLTTHLMEEAEILCDRIGIINRGKIKCIGTIRQLKAKYGHGYRITISYTNLLKKNKILQNESIKMINNEQKEQQQEHFQRPEIVNRLIEIFSGQIVNQLNSRIILKIDQKDVMNCIMELKQVSNLNWLISQPSLYDVFIHFLK